MEVRLSRAARSDVRAASDWWTANRPMAPQLFLEELERALLLIEAQPDAGQAAADADIEGTRRVVLHRTRYVLYYRVHAERVEVLRLWHASRGEPPKVGR